MYIASDAAALILLRAHNLAEQAHPISFGLYPLRDFIAKGVVNFREFKCLADRTSIRLVAQFSSERRFLSSRAHLNVTNPAPFSSLREEARSYVQAPRLYVDASFSPPPFRARSHFSRVCRVGVSGGNDRYVLTV